MNEDWQLIETAPKDREILVWRDGWGRHIAKWDQQEDEGFYRLAQGGCILCGPTHWQSLPDPPQNKSQ